MNSLTLITGKVVNIEEETVRYLQLAALYQTIFSESRMIVKPEVTAIEDTGE